MTRWKTSIPRASARRASARTASRVVSQGKREPQGAPSGDGEDGNGDLRTRVLRSRFLGGLGLGQTHRGDLGIAEGDLGDVDVRDDHRVQPGDLLGQEDALLEAAVGQLQTRDDVPGGVDVPHAGVQALVGDDEAAVHRDPGFLVAHVLGVRTAAHGHPRGSVLLDHVVHPGLLGHAFTR